MFASETPSTAAHWQNRGITLIELMLVITLLGVLVALAAPSFADFIRQQRVKSMREEMMASLALSKVEAITRGHNVVLLRNTPCPQAAGRLDWDCGWTAFVDLDNNNARDANEPVLHEVQGKPGTRIRRSPVASIMIIERSGRLPFGRFEIFPAGAAFGPANGLLLCISSGGRVRSVSAAIACPQQVGP